ncbi:hypothetical protein JVU11DRAFT_1985 [Chiua virens]|nr:hypothetical protein JVU11DRAFT_1985 [Chiua virens]
MHKADNSEGEPWSGQQLRSIPGNAHIDVKEMVQRWLHVFCNDGFGKLTSRCLSLVEVSIVPNVDEPARQEARVVLELVVTQDVLSGAGTLHGSCITHLVDICTTLPIAAVSYANGGDGSPGVSQNIHIVYHAPAHLGDQLRLITTSTTIGRRTRSARIEVRREPYVNGATWGDGGLVDMGRDASSAGGYCGTNQDGSIRVKIVILSSQRLAASAGLGTIVSEASGLPVQSVYV